MNEISLLLWDKALLVRYPGDLQQLIDGRFAGFDKGRCEGVSLVLTVQKRPDGRFTIDRTGSPLETVHIELDAENLSQCLMDAALSAWASVSDAAAVIDACAVRWGEAALLVAGAGKAPLANWFVNNQFGYLSDTVVSVSGIEPFVTGIPGPQAHDPAATQTRSDVRLGLIVFAELAPESELQIQPLSAGAAALRLMPELQNGQLLPRNGFSAIAGLARRIPAVALQYGDVFQLDGVADRICKMILDERLDPEDSQRLLSAFAKPVPVPVAAPPTISAAEPPKFAVPPPTPRRNPVKLTIGMATYDDYDGVYFSIQALRLYHPEVVNDVEYIVIDNHPDGRCSEALKSLEAWIPNYRYVPELLRTGTSQSRNLVFEEAAGESVLCMDCHVFIVPGALRRLLDYFKAHPQTSDLLQGPILMDDLSSLSTHFKPGWEAGMYGTWDTDQRGTDPDAAPFEIPMQGLGLFACRREAWLGFHPDFRGFGGEEGYIHEKFRQHGHRTLCLPFLRWMHRFQRPMGVPYPIPWDDRIRNYLIGHRELGLASDTLELHFRELVGAGTIARALDNLALEQTPTPPVAAPAIVPKDNLDLVPRLADAIEFEVLGDQIAIYDSLLKKATHLLNPSASLVFVLCDGKRTLCDIVSAIEERFPQIGRDVTGDVTAVIRDGCERGVIVLSEK